ASCALCLGLLSTPAGSGPSYLLAFALGGVSAPLYALGSAYTFDWLPKGQVVSASTALLITYSFGAALGPLLAAVAMVAFGTHGFFWALLFAHALLAAFMSYRIIVAPDRAATPLGVD
ncbi:MAG TPA: hypothetical protein VGM78_05915, partial [Ilumatobacteraceae bacterium]